MPGQEWTIKDLHIPAITLVPHYSILAIDEVTVKMKVKLSTSDEDDKDRKGNKPSIVKKDYFRL